MHRLADRILAQHRAQRCLPITTSGERRASRALQLQVACGRAVIARPLRQLIEVATTQPNVTVQVIPFTAGAHAATEGPFAIIEFGVEPGAVLLCSGR